MQRSIFQTQNKNDLPVLSVSQYNNYINDLVSVVPVLVEGEVSNYKQIPGRNFCYFDIKDEKSVAKCFQGFWSCGPVALQNGSKIKVFGVPNVQKNGSFVIDVREIHLTGQGELMEAYLKLKKQLEQEGLFDERYKKELPMFPRTIGLIAGKNSSAFHDVTVELAERWKGLKIFFVPAKVQGASSKTEVVNAIRWFNTNQPVDVLIIARGGGSMEDLQSFSTEEVVREIFASKIPIISAIGHEDHWTLADYVADVRAKTPTKAAQIAVADKQEIQDRLEYFSSRMESLISFQIKSKREGLNQMLSSINHLLNSQINNKKQVLGLLEQKLDMALGKGVDLRKEKLNNIFKQLELLNPLNVLKRGYSVAEKNGKRVTSIDQLAVNEQVKITLPDGSFDGKVECIDLRSES